MDTNNSNGMGRLVSEVNKEIEDSNKATKMESMQTPTSNDMFKASLMNFVSRQTAFIEETDENEKLLTSANKAVIESLVNNIEEDGMDNSEKMRFSELLSKQKSTLSRDKTNRLATLVELIKPTKESSNPLLNNNKEDTEENDVTSDMSSGELKSLLKLFQIMSQEKKPSNEVE